MIQATFFVNESGELTGFLVHGHAGYADVGQDIVCAGVSALVQAAVLGLERFLERKPLVVTGEEADSGKKRGRQTCGHDAFVRVLLPPLSGDDRLVAKIILETLEMGIEGIASGFSKYVRVRRCRYEPEKV